MDKILEKAKENEIKVILVGDEKQLQPIEVGGTLHMVDQHLAENYPENSSVMQDIKRQNHEWMKEAVKLASSGQTKEALEIMMENQKIKIHTDQKQARKELIKDYINKSLDNQKEAIIVANTKIDTHIINKEIRQELQKIGSVGENKIEHFNGVKHIGLAQGDRIIFGENNYKQDIDVRNGQRATVTKVYESPKTIEIEMDGGEKKLIDLQEYHKIDYGWATTTYKAQSQTVDKAYIYGFSQDYNASRQSTYVQISRAREETKMYVVSGEATLELEKKDKEQQLDFEQIKETKKEMYKSWGRDDEKVSAFTVQKEIEENLDQELSIAHQSYKMIEQNKRMKREQGLKRELKPEIKQDLDYGMGLGM